MTDIINATIFIMKIEESIRCWSNGCTIENILNVTKDILVNSIIIKYNLEIMNLKEFVLKLSK
ncbi:MAG: hypothetical protein IJH34_15240 [Romboutsia sp.]|nr:hypothetical protein [Romboutsia sp.]